MELPIILQLPNLTEHEIDAIKALTLEQIHRVLTDRLEDTEITILELSRFMLHGLTVLAVKKEQEPV